MKQTFLFICAITLGFLNIQAQTSWNVDPSHSKVSFSVSHLVISEVDGNFKTFNGSLTTKGTDFANANISFSIDVNSIDTDSEQRDGHLKSEDFFYTEKYSTIEFTSTSFTRKKGDNYKLTGNLTMRGVTKKVTFDVKYGGTIDNDGYGNTKAGFIIKGALNRIDYGVAWNAKTEHGGWTVGEEVDIVLKLELVKGK